MQKPNLLILGAGQFGLMVKEIAQLLNFYHKIDFLDDASDIAIDSICNHVKYIGEYSHAVVAIGNPDFRLEWISKLSSLGYVIPNVVSNFACVSPTAILGEGIIIEPMAVVQSGAEVSSGCIISSGAVVRHNAVLLEGCHADCNSVVLSNSIIPAKTKINCSEVR